MGLTENLMTIEKPDLDEIIKKERSYKERGYALYDSKSYITKASKQDLLDAINYLVESDKFSHKKYMAIDYVEDHGSRIFVAIKWLKHILLVSLTDSSEGTLMFSELFTDGIGVPNNSLCSNIIKDCLNHLGREEEKNAFKSGARKQGVKNAAKYGVSEIIKCVIGVFIILIVAAVIRAIL